MIGLHPPDQLSLLADRPSRRRVTVVRSHLRTLDGDATSEPVPPVHQSGAEALAAIVGIAEAQRLVTLLAHAGWWIAPVDLPSDTHHTHRDGDATEGTRRSTPILPGSTLHRALRHFATHPSGLTSDELDVLLGTRRPTGSNRRLDLQHAGCVHPTDRTRPTPSGRPARVHAVTDLGRAVLTRLETPDA